MLEHWIKAGLALYKANPLLIELVFSDTSQSGFPTDFADGLLTDSTKRWIPGQYTGGVVRYSGAAFPITDNTGSTLTITGDPQPLLDPDLLGYQIVPPQVARLTELITTQPFVVQTSFAKTPTQFPTFTIRLERDIQEVVYIGGQHEEHVLDATGQTLTYNGTQGPGAYLISIWTKDRLSCLWLYAWLLNWFAASQEQFGSWGWSDVWAQGSDIDPMLQFLPEDVYARHLLITATRTERALTMTNLEEITGLEIIVNADYARIVTPPLRP